MKEKIRRIFEIICINGIMLIIFGSLLSLPIVTIIGMNGIKLIAGFKQIDYIIIGIVISTLTILISSFSIKGCINIRMRRSLKLKENRKDIIRIILNIFLIIIIVVLLTAIISAIYFFKNNMISNAMIISMVSCLFSVIEWLIAFIMLATTN